MNQKTITKMTELDQKVELTTSKVLLLKLAMQLKKQFDKKLLYNK